MDIYGFDFGMSRDGRIVVFEVNAAMALGLEFDFENIDIANRLPMS